MSDNGTSRPLTRREIRERERAQAESAAPAAPPVAPPTGHNAPPVVAPPSAPTRSRRSLREATAVSPPSPVVRPPAASSGMRSLDSTGMLTPVHETAESVVVPPIGPQPEPGLPPRRASTRTAAAPGNPSHPTAGVPSALSPGAAYRSGVQPGQQPGGPAVVDSSAPVAPPAIPQVPPRQAPATPHAGSPWGRAASGAHPQSAAVPPAFAVPPTTESGPFSPMAGSGPFAAVESASGPFATVEAPGPFAPGPETSVDNPFAAMSGAEPNSPFAPVVGENDGTPFAPIRANEPEQTVRSGKKARKHSYTWLQYLILFIVAVVLGLLIWQLVLDDTSAANAASASDTVVEVVPTGPTTTPHPR